jgi:hypothetical protein
LSQKLHAENRNALKNLDPFDSDPFPVGFSKLLRSVAIDFLSILRIPFEVNRIRGKQETSIMLHFWKVLPSALNQKKAKKLTLSEVSLQCNGKEKGKGKNSVGLQKTSN